MEFSLAHSVVAQGHKCENINVTVMNSITTRGNELFNIFISSPWHPGQERSNVGNLIVLMGERSVLTLCFLCLPRYMHDTA